MLWAVVRWNPDPILFELGPITVRWYGLMFALALIATHYLGVYFFRKDGKAEDKVINLSLLLFMSGLIGARLGHCIFYEWEFFSQYPSQILNFGDGGMASHGGVLMMLIVAFIYQLNKNWISFLWMTDKLAIQGALATAFIRIGNLMNSEIIGKASDLPWAFLFVQRDSIPRHPSVLYEAIAYLGIFFFLFWMDRKKPKTGIITALFMIVLFSVRILIEFTKADAVYTQFLSLPFIFIGIALFLFLKKKKATL